MPTMRPMTPATSLMPSTTELERTCIACLGLVMSAVTTRVTISAVSAFHLRKKTRTIGTMGMRRATGLTSFFCRTRLGCPGGALGGATRVDDDVGKSHDGAHDAHDDGGGLDDLHVHADGVNVELVLGNVEQKADVQAK